MKTQSVALSASLVITFVILALTPSSRLAAQNSATKEHHHYKLIDLGTLGGPESYLNDGNGGNNSVTVLNNQGTLASWADTSAPDAYPAFCFNEDCYISHAFEARAGVRTDLGALVDGVSSQANWISPTGLIAGLSENGEIDPLFPGLPEVRAVLWRDHRITDLGILPEGGYESWANAVNSQGQVIGWATNTVPDANSLAAPGFLPTQTRAFLWQDGAMRDLGTLGTGTDAIAEFINERGQIVGWSYTGAQTNTCNPTVYPLATGSFVWDEKNGMRDLGTLGGTCTIATGINNAGAIVGDNLNGDFIERAFVWTNGAIQDLGGTIGGEQTGAEGINNSGQVAGFGTLVGESSFHATLWERVGEITDLGALAPEECSFATSINSHTQIVGGSSADCTFNNGARAFLWEDGSLVDLNALIPPDSSLHLQFTQTINDRGEIAGTGEDANGNQHAFLLLPCDGNHPGIEGCDYSMVDAATAEIRTRSNSIRRDTSLATPGLETTETSTEIQRSLGAANNPFNQMFRRRLGWAPSLRTPQASALTTTSTTSLTITSGAPPNGTEGVPYGPTEIQYICRFSPVLGFHEVCFPCLPGVATCTGLPPCRGFFLFFPSPCRRGLPGFEFKAAGGVSSYRWYWAAAAGSSIPPGLTLDTYGIVSGTPTLAGTYHVTVTVADRSSPPLHASATYRITVFQ